ncbi:unnamed protein product, partial [Rotaria sp. Silwood2]
AHAELLEQLNRVNQPNAPSLDLFDDINRWEAVALEKVHKAAERARQHLTQLLTGEKDTLMKEFGIMTKEIRDRREEVDFDENDIERLQKKINQMQISLQQVIRPTKTKAIIMKNDQIDWNRLICVEKGGSRITPLRSSSIDICSNAKWTQNGITVAGGNGQGGAVNQLSQPVGLFIDDDQTVYVADCSNHRIVAWKCGATNGEVVAGGNGIGNEANKLNHPYDVIVDKERDSLIICDFENKRVVRWPRRNGSSGKTIISNINCYNCTIDENGFLYVVDFRNHAVKRYQIGDTNGIVVAGGNGQGNSLNQLSCPHYVFIDRDHSVYVSDKGNHRVMKWEEGAKQGIIVAGGQGSGASLTQLSSPLGIVVDQLSSVYVVDHGNDRIMRWPKGASQGSVIAGDNGCGAQMNQFNGPFSLSFDPHGNLYITDFSNHRVQKFNINSNS